MAADVRDWLRVRSQGGPRSRPRDEHTVRMNLNRVHPLLLAWAGQYIHLREVTTADIIAATEPLHGSLRRQTLTALRSLFGHAKKTGTIFRDPTRGVRDGKRLLPGAEGADERCVVRADGAGRENPAGRCCGGVFIGEVPVVVGMVPVVSVDDLGDCGAGSGLVDEVLA